MSFDPALDDWNEGDEIERDETALDDDLTDEQLAALSAAVRARLLEPKPFVLKQSKKRLAIVDTETDPFLAGRAVAPFALGFYDGERYVEFWGDDCVKQFFDYLATLNEAFVIYAHNGGKFDFNFFLPYLDEGQTPLIMGGRMVKIMFAGQEFRDSFAIIPQALSAYQKDEIDYDKFERSKRRKHKREILEYMKSDCVYAFDLIKGFHDMFGDKLTIASAGLPVLQSYHGFARTGTSFDDKFRRYYFGGRNQCFESGVLRGDFKVYDRNSMYPAVMRDELHPVSGTYKLQTEITPETDFAMIDAINDGALPIRADDGGLDFTQRRGTFHATGHEIRAGLDTGTLNITRVRHAWTFDKRVTFAEFVNRFYAMRLDAKARGDRVADILYKFAMNAPYGKFALNPRKFKQWKMTKGEVPEPQLSESEPRGWSLHSRSGAIFIWSRPSPRQSGFINVATAASITGAARANLLRNLSLATRPVYCDTDSIICTDFRGDLDNKALGGWKLEATGDTIAIGGKKLYAVFRNGEVVTDDNGKAKTASKGVRLMANEIMRVAQGETIIYENPVPLFNLDGSQQFQNRTISMTGTV